MYFIVQWLPNVLRYRFSGSPLCPQVCYNPPDLPIPPPPLEPRMQPISVHKAAMALEAAVFSLLLLPTSSCPRSLSYHSTPPWPAPYSCDFLAFKKKIPFSSFLAAPSIGCACLSATAEKGKGKWTWPWWVKEGSWVWWRRSRPPSLQQASTHQCVF